MERNGGGSEVRKRPSLLTRPAYLSGEDMHQSGLRYSRARDTSLRHVMRIPRHMTLSFHCLVTASTSSKTNEMPLKAQALRWRHRARRYSHRIHRAALFRSQTHDEESCKKTALKALARVGSAATKCRAMCDLRDIADCAGVYLVMRGEQSHLSGYPLRSSTIGRQRHSLLVDGQESSLHNESLTVGV